MAIDRAREISEDYIRSFEAGASPRSAMQDNFIVAGLAACHIGIQKKYPVIAWAAEKKSSYPGYGDGRNSEIALMRLLQWAGADVSMPDQETLMTALHYMASTKHGQGSDPRAVKWLLGHGAAPKAKNSHGDTAMLYLCGTSVWGDAQRDVFLMVLEAGCDPREATNDGSTSINFLKMAEAQSPVPLRKLLIDALERDVARAQPGFFTRLVGGVPPQPWTVTRSL